MSQPALIDLADAICAARQLLSDHGDKWVVQRLSELDARLRDGDETAITSAVSESTGGMGSLNDRFLCPENGDKIAKRDVTAINERLSALVKTVEQKARLAAAEYGLRLVR